MARMGAFYQKTRGASSFKTTRSPRATIPGMTRPAQLLIGLSLIVVPTILYGGLTLLGVVSGGAYGTPAPHNLTPLQQAFYRAGHAHAGVLLILSLILQIAIDSA